MVGTTLPGFKHHKAPMRLLEVFSRFFMNTFWELTFPAISVV